MKIHFYFSVLLFLGYQKLSNAKDISTYGIPEQIDEWVDSIRDAIPEVITPSPVDVELNERNSYKGILNVTDEAITGVKEFDVTFTYFLTIPTAFTLTVDSIKADLKYFVDVLFYYLPTIWAPLRVLSDGTLNVELTNLIIDGKVRLSLIPLNLTVHSLFLTLDDAKFTFDGEYNNAPIEQEFNELLSRNFLDYVYENDHAIEAIVEDLINQFIQNVLFNSATKESYNREALMDNDGRKQEIMQFLTHFLKKLSQ